MRIAALVISLGMYAGVEESSILTLWTTPRRVLC